MKITNSEFILLIIISENEYISGYKINVLIEKHGYREWAGIGSTSIYKGLKKLENIKFINCTLNVNKSDKGPIGKQYTLTETGLKKLREELKFGLSETREHNPRFKIALSGVDLLKQTEICKWLKKRVSFLEDEHQRLNKKKELKENKIFKVQMLFEHSLKAINNESKFTKYLINQYAVR